MCKRLEKWRGPIKPLYPLHEGVSMFFCGIGDMTVLEQVKSVCFRANIENREGLHRNVLDGLKALFAKGGYKVHLEYPIHFKSRIRKSGDWISRDGKLDLVAVKNGRRVAIEFDTGAQLKFKSIEKLFQVDADLRIGGEGDFYMFFFNTLK